ncbi:MAG: multicopper oxidase type 2, partial [Candidatus Eremiobacteraeota bacterium]|nr:multicopper oxidase type 2 [Candidatus Eremiobacteraeota bacterium]
MTYKGAPVPPTIRVRPGGRIRITYTNALSATSGEKCPLGPCMGMTNLH